MPSGKILQTSIGNASMLALMESLRAAAQAEPGLQMVHFWPLALPPSPMVVGPCGFEAIAGQAEWIAASSTSLRRQEHLLPAGQPQWSSQARVTSTRGRYRCLFLPVCQASYALLQSRGPLQRAVRLLGAPPSQGACSFRSPLQRVSRRRRSSLVPPSPSKCRQALCNPAMGRARLTPLLRLWTVRLNCWVCVQPLGRPGFWRPWDALRTAMQPLLWPAGLGGIAASTDLT
mmetsp:Transcript_44894/g.104659  ORF Transcript_44894/g.104659 Transcript_44894/m.104659 type:complete len:231 (+) Transcript_44894:911-1603(+)